MKETSVVKLIMPNNKVLAKSRGGAEWQNKVSFSNNFRVRDPVRKRRKRT
jgi:hypothetical protein